jgi:hypothetical protein
MLYVIPVPVGAVTVIVPVVMAQVGWIRVTVGVAGVPGAAIMTTLDEADDVHPAALVTVKL